MAEKGVIWRRELKVLNASTPSNIQQVLQSRAGQKVSLSPPLPPPPARREINIFSVFSFGFALFCCFIESIVFGRNCICGWNESLFRPRTERNHFFWWFADSWVSSSPSNVLEASCKKHLKTMLLLLLGRSSQQSNIMECQTIPRFNRLLVFQSRDFVISFDL